MQAKAGDREGNKAKLSMLQNGLAKLGITEVNNRYASKAIHGLAKLGGFKKKP